MRYNQNGIQIWDLEHCVAFREQKGFWAAPFLQGCVEDGAGKEIYTWEGETVELGQQ